MKVALTIPIEYDGAVFHFGKMPDETMAQLVSVTNMLLTAVPDVLKKAAAEDKQSDEVSSAVLLVEALFRTLPAGAQELLCPDDMDEGRKQALGFGLMQPDTLALYAEGFCKGVVDWTGIEDGDGNAIACSAKNHDYIPLMVKVALCFAYVAKQQALLAKKESAM